MFKRISHLSDIQPMVADKKEIRFLSQPNGITLGCYLFMDSKTFDSPEALECRGIAFNRDGAVVSRPLHKFFNVGEKEWLSPDKLLQRDDIVGIFDKVDGSMIATAWIDGYLHWRSKKAFNSDVVKLARDFLAQPENTRLAEFAGRVAGNGMTAIFELTHPDARIVVAQDKPALQLLHVRDNHSGEYVLLNDAHVIHEWVAEFDVPKVRNYANLSFSDALESLADMQGQEGYVIQFANGDMVKVKCPWYLRLHRSITFLRERDIAMLALNEELDDVKGALAEAGIDLTAVNEVEAKLKGILTGILDEIEAVYAVDSALERKDFAIKHKENPLFGMIMQRYLGKEVPLLEWYGRNRLKDEFSLRVLANYALAEAMDG
jgi:RNA ligase